MGRYVSGTFTAYFVQIDTTIRVCRSEKPTSVSKAKPEKDNHTRTLRGHFLSRLRRGTFRLDMNGNGRVSPRPPPQKAPSFNRVAGSADMTSRSFEQIGFSESEGDGDGLSILPDMSAGFRGVAVSYTAVPRHIITGSLDRYAQKEHWMLRMLPPLLLAFWLQSGQGSNGVGRALCCQDIYSVCDSQCMFGKEICGRGQSTVQCKLLATHADQDFGLTQQNASVMQEHHDLLEQDDSCTAAFKHFFSGRSLDRRIHHPTSSSGQKRNKHCIRLESIQCRRLASVTLLKLCSLPGRITVPGDQPASKSSLDPFICKACAIADRCKAAVLLEIQLHPAGRLRESAGELVLASAMLQIPQQSSFVRGNILNH